MVRWNAVGDFLPRRAPIECAVKVRPEVGGLVTGRREICATGLERMNIQAVYLRPLGQTRRCHIGPRRAAVSRHMHQTVIRADPDDIRLMMRLGDSEDRAVVLDTRVVLGDRAARRLHA